MMAKNKFLKVTVLILCGCTSLITPPASINYYAYATSIGSSAELKTKIINIIAEQLGVDSNSITPNANFINDLGADSLDIVELIMALETAFEIDIPDQDAINLQTAGDVQIYLQQKGK